ncbi:MAG: S-layer homology domain-containing protein [Thermoleophilia bacterium]|nr:S-layer homology domain-containing protein [Thermoleophilia bacterium]
MTTNSFSESPPKVDSGRITWIGQDGSGFGIYLWDSLWGPGNVRKINSQGDIWGTVMVAGDLVVWSTHVPGPYVIKLEHIPSGQERTVAFPTWDGGEISTDGRYIVWVDKAKGSVAGNIFLYDSKTGHSVQLTDDALDEYDCLADDGYVVWERESVTDPANRVDILSYDTRTGITSVLTTAALRYRGIALDSGRVAWLQHDFAHSDIFLYNLRTGQGKIVVATPTSKQFVSMHGDKLVWSDGGQQSAEICVVDLDEQTPALPWVVTSNTAPDVFAQTDGRYLAWDYRPASGDEVHAVDIVSKSSFNFGVGFMSFAQGISRGRLGWTSGSFPNTEVWTAVFPLFDDVACGNAYFEAIQGMAERGLIAGYPKAVGGADFKPGNSVLRAQFAKMICGALWLLVEEGTPLPPFTDLGPDRPDDLYPHEYVGAAYAAGITTGTSATTFSPFASITRAQAVTMACRGVQSLYPGLLIAPPVGYKGSLGNFSSTHQASMQMFEFNGLLAHLQGFGPSWNPWAPASRAELAQILWEVMKKIAGTWGS